MNQPQLSPGSASVHDRVVKGILHRYVEEDASFFASNDPTRKIPRFLLNDVVRFWRTMAVDYANKYRMRSGEKWALRNIKLRMSRKLLFVSGLFMCLSWRLADHRPDNERMLSQELVAHLHAWTKKSPLESLATIVEKYAPALSADIFNSYDTFLKLLSDDEKRKALERLTPEDAYENDLFLGARDVSRIFDTALTKLLFESNPEVSQLAKQYGVF